jgi:uncharacterized protein YdhG (YjbR/CyaY superfamily)
MRSEAATVAAYLASLPDDRRRALSALRKLVRDNLPAGYAEVMNWGMITYEVPLKTCPDTYNGKPLAYAAMASQKNYMALYLCAIYCQKGAEAAFRKAWKGGRKLDMGKVCIRFKQLEDLDLELIGRTIASTGVEEFIAMQVRKPRK